MQTQTQQTQQMTKAVSPYKYANQIVCKKREELNLYANAVLKIPTNEELINGDFPGMDCFGKSRIDFFIFKYEDKKSVKYSLSASAVKLLYEKSKALISEKKEKTTSVETLSPAYTVKLKGGTFNNKTAAEILLENPAEWQKLWSQREYYMQNANNPKYGKNNQKMAAAIDDAIALYNAGQLNAEKAQSTVTKVYSGVKTPNAQTVDARGYTKARTIDIAYDESSGAYSVRIMNCMAPPAKGLVGADLSRATDSTTLQFNLTEEEWWDFIEECYNVLMQHRDSLRDRRFAIYHTNDSFNY